MSQKAYFVYILKNRMNRRFIGITEDAKSELRRHNKGEFKGTKPFKPWQMEWCSGSLSRNDSLRLETQLRVIGIMCRSPRVGFKLTPRVTR